MILRIIRNCLEDKSCRTSTSGVAVLELCQALIRNQDYEIFQPGTYYMHLLTKLPNTLYLVKLELKTVLSLIETYHGESDVKQRAWMLRSLIAHVNTDSVI